MSIPRSLVFLLLCCVLFWSCNTRYGYRCKVSAAHKTLAQPKVNEPKAFVCKELQTECELISASTQSSIINILKPVLLFPLAHKDSIKVDIREKIMVSKKAGKTPLFRDNRKPVNYYARWALIMALISLTVIPFILPILIGPLDLLLGIIALKQIQHSKERGRGRAIFAIVIGMIQMAFLTRVFFEIFYFWSLAMPASIIVILIINYFLYLLIRNNLKNPANKKLAETFKPLHDNTNRLLTYATELVVFVIVFSAFLYGTGVILGPVTFMMAAKALKDIPVEQSNRRLIAITVLVIGLLAKLTFFGLVTWLFVYYRGFA